MVPDLASPRRTPDLPRAVTAFAPGAIVIAYLQNPREKVWGVMMSVDSAGITMRGMDLQSFDDWLRGMAPGRDREVLPSTMFYPLVRVEKILLDEASAGAPSLEAQCLSRTGRGGRQLLMEEPA